MPLRPGIQTSTDGPTKVSARHLIIDQGADMKGKKEPAAKTTEFGANGETLPGTYKFNGKAPRADGSEKEVPLTRTDH